MQSESIGFYVEGLGERANKGVADDSVMGQARVGCAGSMCR